MESGEWRLESQWRNLVEGEKGNILYLAVEIMSKLLAFAGERIFAHENREPNATCRGHG